jgi:outer membrane protein assembly factor BamD (BamD/ComL family)
MKDGALSVYKLLRTIILASLAFYASPGCISVTKASVPQTKQSPRQHVDTRAQQQYYDQGLQHYSNDDFGEAKKAFQRVVERGPNTALGQKAQENLKKIEQILKTLEDIESK